MRVVEVDPQEERRLQRREPRLGRVDDLLRRALLPGEPAFGSDPHLVVEECEPLADPGDAVEHRRADEGRGGEARALQRLGQRDLGVGQPVAFVVARTVLARRAAGEDRGVGGQGQRGGGERLGEAHPALRERVQRRGRRVLRAIAADPVGARRVEGDEQQAGAGGRGGGRAGRRGEGRGGAGPGQGQGGGEQEQGRRRARRGFSPAPAADGRGRPLCRPARRRRVMRAGTEAGPYQNRAPSRDQGPSWPQGLVPRTR